MNYTIKNCTIAGTKPQLEDYLARLDFFMNGGRMTYGSNALFMSSESRVNAQLTRKALIKAIKNSRLN